MRWIVDLNAVLSGYDPDDSLRPEVRWMADNGRWVALALAGLGLIGGFLALLEAFRERARRQSTKR